MVSLMNYAQTEHVVRDTLELVRIPSATGNTKAMADRYGEMLRQAGCELTRYEFYPGNPTLVAAYETPAYAEAAASGRHAERAKTVLFSGHMDVVPLEHDGPAKIESGRVYGRGTCDMKGSLASILEVVRVVREHGSHLPVKLLVVASSLHESPGGRGEDLIALTERVPLEADAGIVMETATKECTVAQLGSATFRIEVRREGETSHQLYTPAGTPHPMTAAAEIVLALDAKNKELERVYFDDIGCGSYFIGSVQSGKFYNQFPTTAELVGVRRYGPEENLEAVEAEFRALLAPIAERNGIRIGLELEKVRDGYRIDKQSPAVAAMVEAIGSVRGIDVPLVGKKTVTDAGIFARALGIPVICHGPDASTAHGDVEYVEIEELALATQVYIQFIERFVAR